jgi:hypothetical protein
MCYQGIFDRVDATHMLITNTPVKCQASSQFSYCGTERKQRRLEPERCYGADPNLAGG